MQTSAVFGAKNFRFFRNLWCVRPDKGGGGVEPVRHFSDKGRGQFFAILRGRLLWTAPKQRAQSKACKLLAKSISKTWNILFLTKFQ